jgi:hypothetical protein
MEFWCGSLTREGQSETIKTSESQDESMVYRGCENRGWRELAEDHIQQRVSL